MFCKIKYVPKSKRKGCKIVIEPSRLTWATRYGVLLKILNDLGYDFEKDSERIHKQNVEFGKEAAGKLRNGSTKKVEDLS